MKVRCDEWTEMGSGLVVPTGFVGREKESWRFEGLKREGVLLIVRS